MAAYGITSLFSATLPEESNNGLEENNSVKDKISTPTHEPTTSKGDSDRKEEHANTQGETNSTGLYPSLSRQMSRSPNYPVGLKEVIRAKNHDDPSNECPRKRKAETEISNQGKEEETKTPILVPNDKDNSPKGQKWRKKILDKQKTVQYRKTL